MNNTIKKSLAIISTLSIWGLQHASAQVTAVPLGTAAPPSALGGYSMSPFDPGSITGTTKEQVGVTWATWGQGYTGNVYATDGTTITLLLSGGVQAVDFYEEPNEFETFDMTAVDSSGAHVTQAINGDAGSAGVGFYETGSGFITEIVVTTDPDALGEAIGEFGLSSGTLTGTTGTVPDTSSSLLLLAMGVAGLVALPRLTSAYRA